MQITITVNDQEHLLDVPENTLLVDVLREHLKLTGTHVGCDTSQCGACTVLVNGKAERSCMLTMDLIAGKDILTIEGLDNNGQLHPVQQAFINNDALQCGYCTSGMIMNAYSLLLENPEPSKSEIIDGMEENLCRCGTYNRVILAIEEAGLKMKGGVKL